MFNIKLDVKGVEEQDKTEGEDDANFHQNENDTCNSIFKTAKVLSSTQHLEIVKYDAQIFL